MGTTEQGRDWLGMNPAHFDTALLPRKHRRQETGEALWSVADLLPPQPETSPKTAAEMSGQADLFSETD